MAWFQVDDQLAMHRKVCEAGNASMGLWVRAGSWSMANLTEGFVTLKAARTLGTAGQAKALVEAGLWLVVDGGYQFHQWGTRQMSAEQIADRRRKRAEAGRKGGQSNKGGKPEASTGASAQASASENGKQNGTPVPVPALEVVTREGNGTSVDARGSNAAPPSPTCLKHPNGTDMRCHACGEARELRKAFDAEQTQHEARQRADFWAEVRRCSSCDENGLIDEGPTGLRRCKNHNWEPTHA